MASSAIVAVTVQVPVPDRAVKIAAAIEHPESEVEYVMDPEPEVPLALKVRVAL